MRLNLKEDYGTVSGNKGARESLVESFKKTDVYIQTLETAVPDTEGHHHFLNFVERRLSSDKEKRLFNILAKKSLIEKRYTVLHPSSDLQSLDEEGLYKINEGFGSTLDRMKIYKACAWPLVQKALDRMRSYENFKLVTHIIVTSCTGFYAPGLEFDIIKHLELSPSTQRLHIGFMGCFAGVTSHRSAHDIVIANPSSRVLVVNVELCSLHFQESTELQNLLGYLQFADGCSASIVGSDIGPIKLNSFQSYIWPDNSSQIQWNITDTGFDMHLDLDTPKSLKYGLENLPSKFAKYDIYAVHPGGRGILEAVESALQIEKSDLSSSYNVLKNYGNMSSATLQFVIKDLLNASPPPHSPTDSGSQKGIAMAFGPGLSLEAYEFERIFL